MFIYWLFKMVFILKLWNGRDCRCIRINIKINELIWSVVGFYKYVIVIICDINI